MTIVLDEPTTGTERHGLATDDERALLAWADAHPIAADKPEAENGRYKLPHPDTGADTAWTRVTTFIEALDDGQGRSDTRQGRRSHLRATPLSDRRSLRHRHDALISAAGGAGWEWRHYRPFVALALQHGLPIVAANVSREEARRVMAAGLQASGFDADVAPDVLLALAADIEDSGKSV